MYYDMDTEKVNSKKLYSIGYNSKLKKYVLADVITWIAWYERYFEITEEEYNMFGTEKLDEIAENLHRNGTESRRFLFSVKDEENTPEQLIIRDKAM